MEQPTKKRKSSNAAGSYLGFSAQCTMVATCLFKGEFPDGFVSLEYVDDVAVHSADMRPVQARQSKVYDKTNPIANRASEFWKTLRNWQSLIESGILKSNETQFILFLAKKRTGTIAESFHAAKTPAEVEKAIKKAETLSETKKGAEEEESQGTRELILEVLADRKRLSEIIKNFNLEFAANTVMSDFHKAVNEAVRFEQTDVQEYVAKHALGWVKAQLDIAIEAKKPAVIAQKDFEIEMRAFLRKLKNEGVLHFFVQKFDAATTAKHSESVFVKQLQILDFADFGVRKIRAINDFLSARNARSQWSDGTVHSSSFEQFHDELVQSHTNYELRIKLSNSSMSKVHLGQLLFIECSSHKATLQSQTVSEFFIRGSFHELAEMRTLGWHPDWSTLV